MIGLCLMIIVLFFGGQQWFNANMAAAITKEQALQIVEEKYAGEILNLDKKNQQFIVDIKRETGNYRVLLDEKSGEILSVKRTDKQITDDVKAHLSEEEIKKELLEQVPGTVQSIKQTKQGETVVYEAVMEENQQQQKVVINGTSGEIMEKTPIKVEETTKRLTEKEASDIALKQVPGMIDDVDTEVIDGMVYYLVEIEVDEENEAVVAINSITGEIKSVTWDDED